MAPMAHPWHGYIQAHLTTLLAPHAEQADLIGTGPFNLGEENDYRVPDLGYHRNLPSELYVPTAAVVVEVASAGDETMAKFDFYARHDVNEIAVVDPTARELRWWVLVGQYMPTNNSIRLNLTVSDLAVRIAWPA